MHAEVERHFDLGLKAVRRALKRADGKSHGIDALPPERARRSARSRG
jgi:3-oxoacyl-[acyl-carrier-protein] synthase III